MKVFITNQYGCIVDKLIADKQREFARAGHELGFYDMGIFVYPVETDTPAELSKRMDGIIASVEYGDLVILQLPTGNGIDFELMLTDKIVAYSQRRVVLLWHDANYRNQYQERFAAYVDRNKDVVWENEFDWSQTGIFLLDMVSEVDSSALPNAYLQKKILTMLRDHTEIPLAEVPVEDNTDFYIRKMLFDTYTAIQKNKFHIKVKDIDETLDYVFANHASVARFGDGEMDIIAGNGIPYQEYDVRLAEQLKEIMTMQSNEKMVVCLSDVFERRERYNDYASTFWKNHLERYHDWYTKLCIADWYGSTFISRPYIDLIDKSPSVRYFQKIRRLWESRNILIVEGENSRSGVGNDLFDNAASVERIIGPSRNAYSKVDELENEVLKYAEGKLILLMLGPTAKVLAKRLSDAGYQAIDLGHIDSEYEWFKMGATSKVKLKHKHTAEHNFDENIEFVEDETYEKQIVAAVI